MRHLSNFPYGHKTAPWRFPAPLPVSPVWLRRWAARIRYLGVPRRPDNSQLWRIMRHPAGGLPMRNALSDGNDVGFWCSMRPIIGPTGSWRAGPFRENAVGTLSPCMDRRTTRNSPVRKRSSAVFEYFTVVICASSAYTSVIRAWRFMLVIECRRKSSANFPFFDRRGRSVERVIRAY